MVDVSDPLRSLDWLEGPYHDIVARPGFQQLSIFEQWTLLCDRVEETRGATGARYREALDRLDYRLKAQLLRWLEHKDRDRAKA